MLLIKQKITLQRAGLVLLYLGVISELLQGSAAAAQDDATALYGEISMLQTYAEPELRSGHNILKPLTSFLQGYFDFKERLGDAYGFTYVLEYAPQFQWDFRLDGTTHANDETNIILRWTPGDPANIKGGNLSTWFQVSRTLGSLNTSEFMAETGVISPLNGGDTVPGDYNDLIQMIAWEQWFYKERLRLGLGKLTTRTFLNLNRYATGDREDFFTPMLVNNPVVPFTARNGMGLFSQYHWDAVYLTGMLREADGTTTGIDLSTIDSGNWEYAFELGLTPANLGGLGEGYYRIMGYYTDSIGYDASYQPAGWAMALSFDQDIGSRLGALVRYSWASETYRAFKQRLALGLQIKTPFRFQYDRIGLGAWWGDATSPEVDYEYGLEAYWKLQLAPFLELTPDFQVILNPQGDQNRDAVIIGGLRLRVVL